jgi:prepilin-type N-terminal cleavage/methylation domain-containing protein
MNSQQIINPQKSKRTSGFTVLEMLVAMGLLGIFLTLISQFLTSGFNVMTTISNQTKLQEEMRATGSMMTEEIQRALYIFPPCGVYSSVPTTTGALPTPVPDNSCAAPTGTPSTLKVTWSKFTITSSGNTFKNPATSTTAWQVGGPNSFSTAISSSPMLVMIVAPRNPSFSCNFGITVSASNPPTGAAGCYTFIAYYPVLRSNLSGVNSDQLVTDADNNNDWVLMEYRRELDRNLLQTTSGGSYVAESATTTNSSLTDRIPWGDVGCFRDAAPGRTPPSNCIGIDGKPQTTDPLDFFAPPIIDPSPKAQEGNNAIPSIRRSENDPIAIARFRQRMIATRDWINSNSSPGSGKILLDFVKPTDGFQVLYNANTVDERGVNKVTFNLQLSLKRGSKTTLVPGTALEFTAAPRNIAP